MDLGRLEVVQGLKGGSKMATLQREYQVGEVVTMACGTVWTIISKSPDKYWLRDSQGGVMGLPHHTLGILTTSGGWN